MLPRMILLFAFWDLWIELSFETFPMEFRERWFLFPKLLRINLMLNHVSNRYICITIRAPYELQVESQLKNLGASWVVFLSCKWVTTRIFQLQVES
jgi:hypothetical protein